MSPLPASNIVNALQLRVERERASLARRMHDELGGYLLAIAMDLSSLRQGATLADPRLAGRFERIKKLLHAALDVSRAVTEELHPSLLDNVGLFAALRRENQHMCARSNIVCREHFPNSEPTLTAAIGIALFRIGQEALLIAEAQPDVSAVDFHVTVNDDRFWMYMGADVAITVPKENSRGAEAWESVRHRVEALRGSVQLGPCGDFSKALIIDASLGPHC